MIFSKPSTRTRVSFETGIAQLGGTGLYLSANDLQLGRGETIKDTAIVLSRYLDAIMIRTFKQSDVDELAKHASIPVINGLTDEFHPCQALADVMTIRERFGELSGRAGRLPRRRQQRLPLADGRVREAGRELRRREFRRATSRAPRSSRWARAAADPWNATVEIVHDAVEGAAGADVLYTDVWTSMGQDERARAAPRRPEGLPDRHAHRSAGRRSARSSCTASPRTTARRSPRTSCTASAPRRGTRPRIACTRRRRSWRSSSSRSCVDFEEHVRRAIDSLPDDLREAMSNVAILVEDENAGGARPVRPLHRGRADRAHVRLQRPARHDRDLPHPARGGLRARSRAARGGDPRDRAPRDRASLRHRRGPPGRAGLGVTS